MTATMDKPRHVFVSVMQWLHHALAWPAGLWVRGNGWCGRQWERLRP